MADRGDTHYHVPRLNRWFAFSSLVLLVTCVWMVLDDWNRPWKSYQREFQRIEVERAERELMSPEAQAALAEEERLEAEMEAAEDALSSRRTELEEAEALLREYRADQFISTEAEKKAKQEFNWERFLVEEERIHSGNPEYGAERIAGYEERWLAALGVKQVDDAQVLDQTQRIAELRSAITRVESEMKRVVKDVDLVRKRLATLAPKDAPTKIANVIRDFPGLDFIGPSLTVNKVVLDDLTFELNFTKKKRIDMCMTCHVPIDRAGFEDEEQPFRSHPRLDLFLSAKSPHPLNEVGCTICHRGSGEALDFVRADHRPSNEAEGDEWYEEYHWHKKHYWDYPMLSSRNIEASCVQCHKTSMELIADEAPRVAEGYRLFERYGCYSCHKVDWFPTKRRPGPSLKGIRGKTDVDWVASWVTNPKSFRPTTWMPQVFHLENFPAAEEVVTSKYGEGDPILGQAWNDTAVAAVTELVWNRGVDDAFPPIPVEGDARRGREVFRVSGCLACHNVAPYGEPEERPVDLAQRARGSNEHGPNLRGVASKVTPEWLYAWVKDPAAYWPETRMPDLRLSDQDAADVVAYMTEDPEGIFHDVPEGWRPAPAPYDRDALEEQARWFFNRTARAELQRRFDDEWSDDRTLLEAVGEKWVLNQGCHSCHEISGLEGAMPIGTELTTWASKTVDKLDWGFMHEIIAEGSDWPEEVAYHKKTEMIQYQEPWLAQKLHAPRSFDRRKVKNPTEKLRMPWFDFSDDEVEALVTFVGGLVEDEVQRARMRPDAEQLAMDHGLRVVRQKNCEACHLIEPGTIAFTDDDGVHREVKGQILPFVDWPLPPSLATYDEYVAEYVAAMREDDEEFELEDVVVQLLEPVPGLGDVGTNVVVEDVQSVRTSAAWGGDLVDLIVDHYQYPYGYDPESGSDFASDPDGEGLVQDVDGEWRDYSGEPYEKLRWTFAPPVLTNEGGKLQKEWFYRFLLDPVPLREQLRVRMPTFTWEDGEAGAVASFFASRSARQWPARYARRLLLALDADPAAVAAESAELSADPELARSGVSPISAQQVQGIVDGDEVATFAALSALLAYGEAKGFSTSGPVDPGFEDIPQRSPSVLEPLLERDPDFFETLHRLAVEGPNCVQCHFLQGRPPTAEGPIAWAPDLDLTRDRLRPAWLREWLVDPGRVYPGTAMPANFPPDQAVWQDLYPHPSEKQIEAVVTWLFNLDRAAFRN